MRDQLILADAHIVLPQLEAVLARQPNKFHQRAMRQLGVRREHHFFRLHRGVDDNLRKVLRLRRPGANGNIEALLDQREYLLLTHALSPAFGPCIW